MVRYNPEGDVALNARQTARLKKLSNYCRAAGQRFMFELLVPPTQAQLDRSEADQDSYHQSVRPALMLRAISVLQDAGVEPDVWTIKGLDRREDCERVVAVSRRDGRDEVGCIVLGRHADEEKVASWLRTAASILEFIGFAVGRTTFWDAIVDYVKKRIKRREAASRVAKRYRGWLRSLMEHVYRSPARHDTTLFDKPPPLRVGHGLEAVVCAELAVDVMEVVAKCLTGDSQSARNCRGVAAVREELENATLLLGKRFDRCVLGGIIGEPNEPLGDFHHLVEQLLLATTLADIVRQADEQPASRSMIVEDDRRDVHPDSASIAHSYLEVEILDTGGRSVGTTNRCVEPAGERAGA